MPSNQRVIYYAYVNIVPLRGAMNEKNRGNILRKLQQIYNNACYHMKESRINRLTSIWVPKATDEDFTAAVMNLMDKQGRKQQLGGISEMEIQ